MGCTTSFECKTFSKQIRNMDEAKWEEAAAEVCYPGIKAKFCQNPYAMDCLIRKTGSKRIVECAADCLWATGIPLNDPTCLDETKWISPGILGQMLESIQNEQALHLKSLHSYHSNTAHQTLSNNEAPSSLSETLAVTSHRVLPSASHTQTETSPTYDRQVTVMEGLSSSTETHISSVSTSTTPVSDTTETDTDTGDATSYPHQDCGEPPEQTSNIV